MRWHQPLRLSLTISVATRIHSDGCGMSHGIACRHAPMPVAACEKEAYTGSGFGANEEWRAGRGKWQRREIRWSDMRWKRGGRAWLRRHERALRRGGIALAILAYIAVWGYSGSTIGITTDLDAFFLPSARMVLAGHPWQAYTVRYLIVYPNANGPLSLLPLTALAALAAHLGWLGNPELRRAVILAGFAPFLLLLAYEVVRAIDFMRGAPLRGWTRLAAYAMVLLAPTNWISLLFYGHVEQPLTLWLAFLGTRQLLERRAGRAGVIFGLALLSRSAAVLFPLALVLVLLYGRQLRTTILLCAGMAGTLALGLLPFWLADRGDLLYSLAQFRGELPVGGGNVWGLLPFPEIGLFARQWDSAVTLGVAIFICVIVLFMRAGLPLESPALYDVLAAASLCFPLFIKTLWPYYFFEPWVFVVLWWFGWRPLSVRARIGWTVGAFVPVTVLLGAAVSDQWRLTFFAQGDGFWWNVIVTATLLVEVGVLLVSAVVRPSLAPESTADPSPEVPATPLPVAPAIEG